MAEAAVLVSRHGTAIAVLTLNRPASLNAFNWVMADQLLAALAAADADDTVRVVVLTGRGSAYCAGADLSVGPGTFDRAASAENGSTHRDRGGQISLAIHRMRKPVIAAINGSAVGVGITMTLPADVRVVAESAKIGFVFARRGIVPEACSSYFLPRLVGVGKALEWCTTGRTFLARDEAASGLFNHVVPADRVLPKALEIAAEIAQNTSMISVALVKELIWDSQRDGATAERAHLNDSRSMYYVGGSADAKEGVLSFLEKRPPNFSMTLSKDLPDFYPWIRRLDVTVSKL